MPREDLCALTVIREIWQMLKQSKSIEDAKKKFRELVLKLILEE